jgi:NOL1/NOP2/sun family putative RNA methylase
MNLPIEFEKKMQTLLKEDYSSYLACFEEPRHYGLRVNTNKISVEDFLKLAPWPLEPIPWIENGFYYDGETYAPARHPYYFAGLYYLQEPSAMTPANRLPVSPGERVLDVCAAPGGKATELGAKLQGEGLLIANDISNSRAKGLLKNLELFGISNLLVMSEEPGKLVSSFPEFFDKILIDAPCSGEGMFRKEKKMVKAWEEHGPEFFSKIQRSILAQAAQMLRPGGMLLYSTCTFDPSENEQMIAEFLTQHPEFSLEEMKHYEGFTAGFPEVTEPVMPEIAKTMRIFPHKMRGEGHYLALMKKKSIGGQSVANKALKTRRPVELPEEFRSFWEQVDWSLDVSRLEMQGERLYYMPDGLPQMKKLRFLRSGLLLGECKKNRFEPSQALAMALRMEQYAQSLNLSVTDERVIRYLKGETLDVEDLLSESATGWYLVCVDGYPLGFGKVSRQLLKNKYLPGWRWMGSL